MGECSESATVWAFDAVKCSREENGVSECSRRTTVSIVEEASAIAARQWRHHRLTIMQRYRKALGEADFETIEAVFQEAEGDE
jgi:hypothetical protein